MITNTLLRRAGLATYCALALMLGACSKQELYSQLSERQANEMVAVLRSAGIDAEKQVREGQFSVATASGDFAQAVRTLSAQGYPRESYDSMGKVFKREGFVSSPLEERARLQHAMSQEISNTLANIDGVVFARVHLTLPEKNPLADKPAPASASVFIKHRPEKNLSGQITSIKAIVVNSIEGLAYDNVTVALFPAENIPAEPVKATSISVVPQTISGGLAPLMAGTFAGALALGGGGLLWWRRRSTHTEPQQPAASVPTGKVAEKRRELATTEMQSALRRAAGRK
jgi:type III secretion protein J